MINNTANLLINFGLNRFIIIYLQKIFFLCNFSLIFFIILWKRNGYIKKNVIVIERSTDNSFGWMIKLNI